MFQSITFFIISRYIQKKKNNIFSFFMSILSISGVSLGISSVIIVISIMNGFKYFIEKKILFYTPHVTLTTNDSSFDPKKYNIKNIKNLKEIHAIIKTIKNEIILESNNNLALANMISLNKKSFNPLLNYLDINDYFSLIYKKYQVILGIELAKSLKVNKGDKIRLIIPNVVISNPFLKIISQRIFTVIGFFSTKEEPDSNQILINEKDARKLMRYPKGYINGWRLFLKKPLEIEKFKKKISLQNNMIWKDWREENKELFQSIKIEKNTIGFLFFLIIIIASFNIFISIYYLIIKKFSDIAILKTLGLNNAKITIIFILYGTKNSIIGVILGTILGIIISKHLNFILSVLKILDKYIFLPIVINFYDIFLIVIFSILFLFAGILYTSFYTSKIKPIKILCRE